MRHVTPGGGSTPGTSNRRRCKCSCLRNGSSIQCRSSRTGDMHSLCLRLRPCSAARARMSPARERRWRGHQTASGVARRPGRAARVLLRATATPTRGVAAVLGHECPTLTYGACWRPRRLGSKHRVQNRCCERDPAAPAPTPAQRIRRCIRRGYACRSRRPSLATQVAIVQPSSAFPPGSAVQDSQ